MFGQHKSNKLNKQHNTIKYDMARCCQTEIIHIDRTIVCMYCCCVVPSIDTVEVRILQQPNKQSSCHKPR